MGDTPDLEKGRKPDPPPLILEPEDTVEDGKINANADRKLEGDGDVPYASHCRADAQIWGLYLKETEMEDKEVTDLWNSSLDSLLVFAGLFAAILTAFLVESSKDLKEDPQEHLLKEIVNILRNSSEPSTPQPFQPDSSSLHINGLWFSSLTLTLISALGGVLAKGWLGKYNPASLRQHSSDACERELRATRARQWQLEPTITAIPLLIQISLFLFFAGLIIQIVDNDVRIWSVVVTLVGLTALLYLVATCLPWFSPACPFQTPISSLFPGGTARDRYRANPAASNTPKERPHSWAERFSSSLQTIHHFLNEVRRKPGPLELQAQILAWVIANSTNEQTIEEAIATVGGSKPTKELQGALVVAGAGDSLYQRLQNCVKLTPGMPKLIHNEPQLERLLHALLRIEQPLLVNERPVVNVAPTSLLDEEQALRRWDDFTPYLQALVFSLRVHMLLNRDRDDHDEMQTEGANSLSRMMEGGSPPYIRSIVFFATVRGLLNGKLILRQTCGLILSKQVLLVDVREKLYSPRGLVIGDAGCNGESAVAVFHREISEKLTELCGDNDERSREAGTKTLIKLAGYTKLRGVVGMAIPRLVKLVKTQDGAIRFTIASALSKLAEYDEFRDAIWATIPSLIELLKSEDYTVRPSAVSALAGLAERAEFRDAIRAVIPSLIELLKCEDDDEDREDVRPSAVSALAGMAQRAEFRDAVKAAIPSLMELLKSKDYSVLSYAVSALVKLADNAEFRDAMGIAIPSLIELLKSKGYDVLSSAASVLVKLADNAEFRDAMGVAIPSLIRLLKSEDYYYVPSSAVSLFVKLADNVNFCDATAAALPSLIELVNGVDYNLRFTASAAISTLSQNVKLRTEIRSSILCISLPALLSLIPQGTVYSDLAQDRSVGYHQLTASRRTPVYSLESPPSDSEELGIEQLWRHLSSKNSPRLQSGVESLSQMAKISQELFQPVTETISKLTQSTPDQISLLLSDISKHAKLRVAVGVLIPQLIEPLQEPLCLAGSVSALADLADHTEFRDAIRAAIPSLIELLKSKEYSEYDDKIQSSTVSALVKLADHTEFRDAIRAAIPSLIKVLKNNDPRPPSFTVSALVKLAEYVEFHDAIGAAIPSLIGLLKREQNNEYEDNVPSSAISALVELAEYAEFREAIRDAIPSLIELLKREQNNEYEDNVPSSAVSALMKLAEYAEFRDAMGAAIPSLIELLKSEDDDVLSSAVSVLAKLADNSEFRGEIKAAIPLLIELLKSKDYCVSYSLVFALVELAGHIEFHDAMGAAIPSLIELLKSEDDDVLSSAVSVLAKLADNAEFYDAMGAAIPLLIKLLKSKGYYAPSSAVSVLVKLADNAEFRDEIKAAIPSFMDLLKGRDYGIPSSAVSVLVKLADNAEFCDAIGAAILSLIELLKCEENDEDGEDVRPSAVSALAGLAERAEFREAIRAAIPSLIEMLKPELNNEYKDSISSSAVSTLAGLAERAEFCEAIRAAVPSLVGLLKSTDRGVSSSAIFALVKLFDKAEFHEAMQAAIPSLIRLLKSEDDYVPSSAVSALVKLADNAEFREAIRDAIPLLIELLKSKAYGVSSSAVSALLKLVEYAEFRDEIKAAIPSLIELLKLTSYDVLSSAVSALVKLAEYAEFRDEIKAVIPSLIDLLKRKDYYYVPSSAISVLVKLADNAEEIKAAILPFLELFTHSSYGTSSTAATLMCTFAEDALLRPSVALLLTDLLTLLKHNKPFTRARAASVIEALVKYPDTRDAILQSTLPRTLVERLHDSEVRVLKPLTSIFCVLVNQGAIHEGILHVILHALNALNLPGAAACGATILSVMASDAHFRDILYEILTIHGSLRLFMQDGFPQDADVILRRMEYFGVLKEL